LVFYSSDRLVDELRPLKEDSKVKKRLPADTFPPAVLAALLLILQSSASAPAPSPLIPTDATIRNTHAGAVAVAMTGGGHSNQFWMSRISNEDFKQAVEDSVLRYHVFSRVIQNSGGADYRIDIALNELKQPFVGFAITVRAKVYWRLTNAKSREVVSQQTIDRHFTAGTGDIRDAQMLEVANEGAIRENIKAAVEEIGQLRF
jgi:hypothetical protein